MTGENIMEVPVVEQLNAQTPENQVQIKYSIDEDGSIVALSNEDQSEIKN